MYSNKNELPVIKETYPYYEISPRKDQNGTFKYFELMEEEYKNKIHVN